MSTPPSDSGLAPEIWALIIHNAGPGDRGRLYQVSQELRDAVGLNTPVLELSAPRSDAEADVDVDDPDPPPQRRVDALCRILGRAGSAGLKLRVHGPPRMPLAPPRGNRLFAHLLRSPPEGFAPRAVHELCMRNLRVEPTARLAMFGGLRALELDNVAGSRDELKAVLRGLPELRRLTCTVVEPEVEVVSLADVVECVPPQLRELSFSSDAVTSEDTACLTRLTGLEELVLAADAINAHHVLAVTRLCLLDLTCTDFVTAGTPLDAFSRLTQLSSLELISDPDSLEFDELLPVQHLPASLYALNVCPDMLTGVQHLSRLTGLCELTLHAHSQDFDMGCLTALTRLSSLYLNTQSQDAPFAYDIPDRPHRLPALRELQMTSASGSDFGLFDLRGLRVLRICGDAPHPLVEVVSALQRGGFRGQLVFDAVVDDADEWDADEWRALTTLYSLAIIPGGGACLFSGRVSVVVPQGLDRERVGVLEDFLRSAAARGAKLAPDFWFHRVPRAFATVSMALALSLHTPRVCVWGDERIGRRVGGWLAALRRHGVEVVLPEAH